MKVYVVAADGYNQFKEFCESRGLSIAMGGDEAYDYNIFGDDKKYIYVQVGNPYFYTKVKGIRLEGAWINSIYDTTLLKETLAPQCY